MSSLSTLAAVLAGLGLLVLPALAFLALLPRRAHAALKFDEALWLGLGVSVSAAAWLAVLLAELGMFSTVRAAVVLGSVSLLALAGLRGRLGRPLPAWPGLRAMAPALIVLALALALQARPSEYIVGGRDPGAYVAAMGLIARTGGLVYTDPAVLSIPAEDVELFYRNLEQPGRPDFSWARFMGFHLERPESGRVFPQFFHLFPAFGAYLFESMGLNGALATPAVFGILGTLGVFLAGRRLFGEGVAVLGSLLLGLSVVQVWFSRYPVSEGVSQFLLFLALLAFALWEEHGDDVFAAIAGSALGLTLLVRIDSVLVFVPLAAWLLAQRAGGRLPWTRAWPLLLPVALLSLHAGVHAAFFASRYLDQIVSRPYWHQPAWLWLVLAAAGSGLLVVADRLSPSVATRLAARAGRLRRAVALALCVSALYAYALRPQLSTWAGGDGNPPESSFTSFASLDLDADRHLSRAELAATGTTDALLEENDTDHDGSLDWDEWTGEPPWVLGALGFQSLAAHDAQSLVRLGWAVTPLAILLGLAGFVLLSAQWRPRALFPLLLALTFSLFYLYKIRVFSDYPFAWRRYMPVTVPFLLLLAAFALVWLARGSRSRRLLAAGLAALLAAGLARETSRIVGFRDWQGAVRFVRDLARRFGPDDVLIFEQPRHIHLLSLPLWAAFGVNALELARFNPDPDRLQHLITAWKDRYRNIYFVHTYRTDLCGVFLQRVEDHAFGSREWFRYDGRPGAPEPRALRFTVSRVVPPTELQVPPLDSVDIGGSDDFQVSGFFDKEGGAARRFRWTGSCASVYLPGITPGKKLLISASAERRPPEKPAQVTVSLDGQSLGTFTATSEWQEHALALPDPLPEGPKVLRLDVPSWRPIQTQPDSGDMRDLGIMLDRIVIADPDARPGA